MLSSSYLDVYRNKTRCIWYHTNFVMNPSFSSYHRWIRLFGIEFWSSYVSWWYCGICYTQCVQVESSLRIEVFSSQSCEVRWLYFMYIHHYHFTSWMTRIGCGALVLLCLITPKLLFWNHRLFSSSAPIAIGSASSGSGEATHLKDEDRNPFHLIVPISTLSGIPIPALLLSSLGSLFLSIITS
jgi:hypothetical protein